MRNYKKYFKILCMEDKKKVVKQKEEIEEEGATLCPKCGNMMVHENGELVCSSCSETIDFFGEDDLENPEEK